MRFMITRPGYCILCSVVTGWGGTWRLAYRTVRLWDVEKGVPVLDVVRGRTGLVESVSLSPGGSRTVSRGSDDTVRARGVAKGQAVCILFFGHRSGFCRG